MRSTYKLSVYFDAEDVPTTRPERRGLYEDINEVISEALRTIPEIQYVGRPQLAKVKEFKRKLTLKRRID